MSIRVEAIEQEFPGGTIRWMVTKFVYSSVMTAKAIGVVVLLTSPVGALSVLHPMALLSYIVLVVSFGIRAGGILEHYHIDLSFVDVSTLLGRDQPTNTSRSILVVVLAMLAGGPMFFTALGVVVGVLVGVVVGPIGTVLAVVAMVEIGEYLSSRIELGTRLYRVIAQVESSQDRKLADVAPTESTEYMNPRFSTVDEDDLDTLDEHDLIGNLRDPS